MQFTFVEIANGDKTSYGGSYKIVKRTKDIIDLKFTDSNLLEVILFRINLQKQTVVELNRYGVPYKEARVKWDEMYEKIHYWSLFRYKERSDVLVKLRDSWKNWAEQTSDLFYQWKNE